MELLARQIAPSGIRATQQGCLSASFSTRAGLGWTYRRSANIAAHPAAQAEQTDAMRQLQSSSVPSRWLSTSGESRASTHQLGSGFASAISASARAHSLASVAQPAAASASSCSRERTSRRTARRPPSCGHGGRGRGAGARCWRWRVHQCSGHGTPARSLASK